VSLRGRGWLRHDSFQIQSIGIGDPAEAAGGDAGDAERDAVATAELGFTIEQEFDESAVDVAEAEEAKVVSMNEVPSG
jgi:hypothetical protein